MSPRPRKPEHRKLPRNWRWKHGAYFYRVPAGERGRWDGKTEFRLGATLSEAYITYGKRQQYVEPCGTVEGLCDRYVFEVLPHKAPATQRSNQYSLQRIRFVFGDSDAEAVESSDVIAYRNHIAAKHSKKAANLDLEVLSHLFSKSIEWGVRKDHPMTGRKVTKYSLASRRRYVTDAELVAFAATLPAKWQILVSLAVWTGRRKAELLNLTRGDLIDDGILFHNVKRAGDTFVVGWTPEIRALIDAALQLRERVSALHVFHTRNGQPYVKPDGTTSGFDSIWQRYMRAWAAAGHERFTFHDLRAKRASELSADQAQSLLRHTSAQMTKRYRRRADVVRL